MYKSLDDVSYSYGVFFCAGTLIQMLPLRLIITISPQWTTLHISWTALGNFDLIDLID